MAHIKGKNLTIYLGSNAIGSATSCDVNIDAETKEVADTNNGQWRKYIVRRQGWSVSCNFLVPTSDTMKAQLQKVGSSYTLKFQTSATDYLSGTAICIQADISGATNDLLKGTFQFQGSGALS